MKQTSNTEHRTLNIEWRKGQTPNAQRSTPNAQFRIFCLLTYYFLLCSSIAHADPNSRLSAGEEHVGEVGGRTALVSGTFTRPSDTTAYTSGDLVANSTTAGSVTPVSFTVGRKSSGSGATGMLRRVRLSKSGTSTTNASFRAHFYSTSPACANGDNGAWSTNQVANYLGAVDITLDKAFTDGAQGIGVPNSGAEINFTAQTVYVLLEARAAYTPSSAEVFTIKLEVIQN